MRVTEPFVVFKRTLKSGAFTFYYQARLPDGRRTPARSTGQRTKAAARQFCRELEKNGLLIPRPSIKFADYAESWWDWDRCAYIKRQRQKRGRFSPTYAKAQRANLVRYILPTFGELPLAEITRGMIMDWQAGLVAMHGLKNVSANHVLSTLKVIFGEALRREDISRDPAHGVEPYLDDCEERGIPEQDEARKLFATGALDNVWDGETTHYLINMIAMVGGLRQGEILSLKTGDLEETGVTVRNSWDREAKCLVPPKTGKIRFVPLPEFVMGMLRRQADDVESTKDGLLFPNAKGNGPVDHKVVNNRFYRALKVIGITEEQRKARRISFHSWRHYANTRLRASVGDLLTREIIGHADIAMQDHYTHSLEEDHDRIRDAQREMLGLVA